MILLPFRNHARISRAFSACSSAVLFGGSFCFFLNVKSRFLGFGGFFSFIPPRHQRGFSPAVIFDAGKHVGRSRPVASGKLPTRSLVRRKASADRLEHTIPEDVLVFIANHVQANVRELEGSVIKLLAYASLRSRPVTLDLAREALRDKVRSAEARPARSSRHDRLRSIQQRVATEWGVTVEGLQAKSRTRTVTVPRQVAMFLSRELLGLQLVEIGNAFGGRDHSTVIHSLDKVAALLTTNAEFRTRVDKIRESLRNDV